MQLTDVEVESIHREVAERGFYVLRLPGFVELCELARRDYFEAFEQSSMQPSRKSFNYTDLLEKPWRKLAVSSTNGIGEPYAQFLQSVYFDHVGSKFSNLNRLFRILIEIRNQLMGVRLDFAEAPLSDGFWNASRVHHYPSGGGFMVMHTDTFFPVALGERSFYQLLAPLSVKGRDFFTGGGVVMDKVGNKYDTDDTEIAGMGTVLVYDGRTRHGVEDVDPHDVVSFESKKGRLAAVCNPYCTAIPERIDK